MSTDPPPIFCHSCRRLLNDPNRSCADTGPSFEEGHGYDPQWRIWTHVGCHDETARRHNRDAPALEQVWWRIGHRVSVDVDGRAVTGEVISNGGRVFRVRTADRVVDVEDGNALRPARW